MRLLNSFISLFIQPFIYLRVFTLLIVTSVSSLGFAHHSFAPHFDSSKKVNIEGIVVEFEKRNPHAYLRILVEDASGQSHEYRCESHGVTMLERNGITKEMLAPGTHLAIDGSQHRRDPYMCFFDNVYLDDGRVLNVNGARGNTEAEVAQRDSIYGTWLLSPAGRSTSGPDSMMDYLTPAGEAAVAAYDPFVDDPTFQCEPVAPRRVWFAPGTPMSIRREGSSIFLRHEWMDVEREVHLGLTEHPVNGERTILGHSIGYFEGDTLEIETANFSKGVLRQYVEQENGPTRGMMHSEQFRVLERIRFDKDNNRIQLSIEQTDPLYYSSEFDIRSAEYAASNMEIEPFGCIPEVLK